MRDSGTYDVDFVVITATSIDALPTPSRGFEAIAQAADAAMIDVLMEDLDMYDFEVAA